MRVVATREAQTQHLGPQLKVAANAGAQVVDAQVDGAQFGKAVQALLGRLAHVLGANGGHHGQPPMASSPALITPPWMRL